MGLLGGGKAAIGLRGSFAVCFSPCSVSTRVTCGDVRGLGGNVTLAMLLTCLGHGRCHMKTMVILLLLYFCIRVFGVFLREGVLRVWPGFFSSIYPAILCFRGKHAYDFRVSITQRTLTRIKGFFRCVL